MASKNREEELEEGINHSEIGEAHAQEAESLSFVDADRIAAKLNVEESDLSVDVNCNKITRKFEIRRKLNWEVLKTFPWVKEMVSEDPSAPPTPIEFILMYYMDELDSVKEEVEE